MSVAVARSLIPRPLERDEWLTVRRPFFNASAAACLWDRHPYMSAADYAVEKLTGQSQSETRAMRRGSFLESSLADWFAYEHGVTLVESGDLFVGGPMMATVDRLKVTGSPNPVEFKTANGYISEPEQYWLDQCQAIMLCTGDDVIDLVWLDASMDFQHQVVDADEAQQVEMVKRAERFMAAIELGIVPDWVRPEITARHVSALFPNPDGEVELDAETAELVSNYRAMKSEVKEYEAAMEEIKSQVAARLGEHEVGTVDGVPVVTFKAVKDSEKVDTKRLRAEHPDLVEQYLTTQPGGRRFLPVP